MKRENKMSTNRFNENSLIEANEWLMKIKSSTLTSKAQKEFATWLSKNQVNKDNYDLLDALWNNMDVVKDNPLVSQVVEESLAWESRSAMSQWFDKFKLRLPTLRFVTVAATIVLMVLGIWLTQPHIFSPKKTYHTDTGEQRLGTLS